MADFVDMVLYLQGIGVAEVLLPFFLVFTIVYSVFMKTKILGKSQGAKRFNVIVAAVMGFAVIFPHVIYRRPDSVVNIINDALPRVALVLVAILMLLLMIGAFGKEWKLAETSAGSLVVFSSLAIIIYIFGTSAGWWMGGRFPSWLYFLGDPQTQSFIVTLLVFGVIVWLITREEKPAEERGKLAKNLREQWFALQDLEDKEK